MCVYLCSSMRHTPNFKSICAQWILAHSVALDMASTFREAWRIFGINDNKRQMGCKLPSPYSLSPPTHCLSLVLGAWAFALQYFQYFCSLLIFKYVFIISKIFRFLLWGGFYCRRKELLLALSASAYSLATSWWSHCTCARLQLFYYLKTI